MCFLFFPFSFCFVFRMALNFHGSYKLNKDIVKSLKWDPNGKRQRNTLPPPAPVGVLKDFFVLLHLGQPPPPFPTLPKNWLHLSLFSLGPARREPSCVPGTTHRLQALFRQEGPTAKREHLACFQEVGESPWFKQSAFCSSYAPSPRLPHTAGVCWHLQQRCPCLARFINMQTSRARPQRCWCSSPGLVPAHLQSVSFPGVQMDCQGWGLLAWSQVTKGRALKGVRRGGHTGQDMFLSMAIMSFFLGALWKRICILEYIGQKNRIFKKWNLWK